MAEERLHGNAEDYLAAALSVARLQALTPTWYEVGIRALEAASVERPVQPAPTLAVDLAALMHGERLLPVAPPAQAPVREALRAYEDHVLARLTADRRWTRLTEALAGAPRALRPAAVGMTVAALLQRLQVHGGVGVPTGVVRRLVSRPIGEVLEQGRVALHQPALAARLASGLEALARAARRTRDLLTDAEVFTVENVAALKGLGARVALGQLAEVAQLVEEQLPRRLKGAASEDGDAPTALEEDSAFPVGGFASLATSGSLENLVTSELMYLDQGATHADRPDLFDVRFVEGELLYYARDESVAVRRRRTVVVVLDASLVRARVLDPREPWQRLVWLLGCVAAMVRRLAEWQDTDALRFELVFVGALGQSVLGEERDVLGLLLREFRERGQLELLDADSAAQAVRRARATHRQRTRLLVFSVGAPAGLETEAGLDVAVDLAGPRPVLRWRGGPAAAPEPASDAAGAWVATTRRLLEGLMRQPRVRAA
jgi:vWA domain found in the FtsH ternary systems/N-terminal helical region fused to the FtsH ternary system vWA domain